jgi:hypothetical protein
VSTATQNDDDAHDTEVIALVSGGRRTRTGALHELPVNVSAYPA